MAASVEGAVAASGVPQTTEGSAVAASGVPLTTEGSAVVFHDRATAFADLAAGKGAELRKQWDEDS
jgi:hypothetical protein